MRFENLIPVLDVRDVDVSIEFYCDTLGFSLADKVEWSGRTEWALLRTGKVNLMLCAGHEPSEDELPRSNEGVFFVYLDSAEALHVYLGAQHKAAASGAIGESQNGRDFYLRDPDGYVLWFSHKPMAGDGLERGTIPVLNAA